MKFFALVASTLIAQAIATADPDFAEVQVGGIVKRDSGPSPGGGNLKDSGGSVEFGEVEVGGVVRRDSGPSPGGGNHHSRSGSRKRRDSGPSPGTPHISNGGDGVDFEEVEVGGVVKRESGPSPGVGNHPYPSYPGGPKRRDSGPSPGTPHISNGGDSVGFEEVEVGGVVRRASGPSPGGGNRL
ncbi:hypothetical protein EG328_011712 [Venturia inaequalis]|uniref:Uncharacterized protein n=1 Tax=Venturia inaequalis TaxID=5025 RepID=A0A8H3V1M2_VENIN|nr:hypothetical protein EG328_011712 [Venturia inaequalis]